MDLTETWWEGGSPFYAIPDVLCNLGVSDLAGMTSGRERKALSSSGDERCILDKHILPLKCIPDL